MQIQGDNNGWVGSWEGGKVGQWGDGVFLLEPSRRVAWRSVACVLSSDKALSD